MLRQFGAVIVFALAVMAFGSLCFPISRTGGGGGGGSAFDGGAITTPLDTSGAASPSIFLGANKFIAGSTTGRRILGDNGTTVYIGGIDAGELNLRNGGNDIANVSTSGINGVTTNVHDLGSATVAWRSGFVQTSMQGSSLKALTETAATTFVKIAMISGSRTSGLINYTIEANDATDFQARSGVVPFVAVDKAGAITCTIGTVGAATEVVAVSNASTLTNVFTCADATGNVLNLLANATSSLTQTTLQINYRLDMPLLQTVTPQ